MRVRAITAHPHYPEWVIRDGYGDYTKSEIIHDVPVTRLLHYVPAQPEGLRRLFSELSFGVRLLFARWGHPDVIVMVSPALFATGIAMLRAKLSRHSPVVAVWVQDIYSLGIVETGSGGRLVARIIRLVEESTLRAASCVVVIHSRFADYLTKNLKVDPARIEVIRNWTHLEAASLTNSAEIRAGYGWEPDETIVLHAGNMGVKQDLENVIAAARLADDQQLPVRFVLLGNGSQRESLRNLGLGVHRLQFIEALSERGFQEALAAADVLLVNEKLGVSEMAVPSKLTSYFNAGRPVLAATDLAGATAGEISEADAGCIVSAGNPQSLLDAALELGSDPLMSAKLGANGLRYRRVVLDQEVAIDKFAAWIRIRLHSVGE